MMLVEACPWACAIARKHEKAESVISFGPIEAKDGYDPNGQPLPVTYEMGKHHACGSLVSYRRNWKGRVWYPKCWAQQLPQCTGWAATWANLRAAQGQKANRFGRVQGSGSLKKCGYVPSGKLKIAICMGKPAMNDGFSISRVYPTMIVMGWLWHVDGALNHNTIANQAWRKSTAWWIHGPCVFSLWPFFGDPFRAPFASWSDP